jgi:hypothetical protein
MHDEQYMGGGQEGDDAVVLNSEVGGVGNEISIIECDGCWFLENYFSGTF